MTESLRRLFESKLSATALRSYSTPCCGSIPQARPTTTGTAASCSTCCGLCWLSRLHGMGRRKAKSNLALRPAPDLMPVSARVAWTYFASLLSAVVAAGLVALSSQSLAYALCQSTDEDALTSCKLGLVIWVGLLGFLVCLVPLARMVKLDWWLLLAMWAGAAFWLAGDSIGDWWWWAIALFLPAAAALISADWARGVAFRRRQLLLVVVLALSGLVAVIWWFVAG